MFKNSSKILFYLTLTSGTLITISSNSWLGAWMGLEINLLSFIPLMSDDKNLMSTEASLKYFLTQALASAILLFGIIIFLLKNNFFTAIKESYASIIIFSSLLLKSGTAPFHYWFPNVMEGLSWMNNLILMTWQKIAPLMLLSYLTISPFMILSIILSSIIGALGGFNQTSLRKLMAFSSINHLGWMLAALKINSSLWMTYFLIYSFISINLVFLFNLFNLFYINQLFSLFLTSKILKFSFFLNLLSLGGLPPFLGFAPKWLVIQSLSLEYQLMLVTILTVTTLITLYFYLRLCYSSFMLNYYENTWATNATFNNFSMKIFLTCSFISTFSLFFIALIYF